MKTTSSTVSVDECAGIRTARRAGASYSEVVEEFEYSVPTVVDCALGNCGHETDEPALEKDKPWTEKFVMEELYYTEDLFFTEMANLLGCHSETARNWVIKHDISVVDSKDRTSSKTVRELQRLAAEQGIIGELDLRPVPTVDESRSHS